MNQSNHIYWFHNNNKNSYREKLKDFSEIKRGRNSFSEREKSTTKNFKLKQIRC